jgi:hypothetical protein
VLERPVELVDREAALTEEIEERAPGSTDPERVAIGRPSSGLKPIVVSTERPSRTAVTEQPPPRCATTRRGTRSATDATASPWKP